MCVNDLGKSLKDITCVIAGKINLDSDKLEAIAEKASTKFTPVAVVSPTSKPESLNNQRGETDYPMVVAKGPMMSSVLCDYISSTIHDRCTVRDNSVIVYKMNWSPVSNDKKIDAWATSRFGKIADLKSALAYLSIMNCEANASAVVSFMKSTVDVKSLAAAVKGAMK